MGETERRERGGRKNRFENWTEKQRINYMLAVELIERFCVQRNQPDFFNNPKLKQPGGIRLEVIDFADSKLSQLTEWSKNEGNKDMKALFAEIEKNSISQRVALLGELLDSIISGKYQNLIDEMMSEY